MTTTTLRTVGAIFSAGILLTSCVSSKKYHRSQDEVAKLRGDSTTLAQQSAALQQNLTSSQQKNTDLQKSVDMAGNTNAGLKKNVAYYHDYADKQQASTAQIKGELGTTLASSGLTDQDVTVVDGKIYVNVSEKSLFKGTSAVLTSKGQELVDNIGQFVKSHEGVDISVADLQQATSVSENGQVMATNTDANAMSGNNGQSDATTTTVSKSGTKTNPGNASVKKDWSDNASATTDKTAHKMAVVHHKKKMQAATSGETKAIAYSSGKHNKYIAERNRRSMARAMAWKRQNVVANALLKDGIPKVKVVAQDNVIENSTSAKGVQVVLVNNMDEFYKHMSEAPANGQPVSANP